MFVRIKNSHGYKYLQIVESERNEYYFYVRFRGEDSRYLPAVASHQTSRAAANWADAAGQRPHSHPRQTQRNFRYLRRGLLELRGRPHHSQTGPGRALLQIFRLAARLAAQTSHPTDFQRSTVASHHPLVEAEPAHLVGGFDEKAIKAYIARAVIVCRDNACHLEVRLKGHVHLRESPPSASLAGHHSRRRRSKKAGRQRLSIECLPICQVGKLDYKIFTCLDEMAGHTGAQQ